LHRFGLMFGHANLADFSPERIRNPEMIQVMQKIRIQADPELSAMYPRKWPHGLKSSSVPANA